MILVSLPCFRFYLPPSQNSDGHYYVPKCVRHALYMGNKCTYDLYGPKLRNIV